MDTITAGEFDLTVPSNSYAESTVDLAALVAAHSALLFRVAHSVLRSRQDAEDVVQEVFLRVLQRRSGLAAIKDLRVWLVRIAWNLALDRRRSIRPDQIDHDFAASLAASTLDPEAALTQTREMTAVLREIERLPHAERHALLLATIDELAAPELAQILGRSEAAARGLLFRARARLRQRLNKGGHPS